ncbi:aspartyl-phosphate phosphatase Spo0E family protein [Bacillus sp. SA1-12]|uniref:aspartyl-phosphate phosphatase Spo0E family protein n=1 Tax=Bacillus sp. SA1-12 TaxID=1455638 RepID=UPI000A07D0CF|nr:aspartyl-phosphate phosphatase Spo0E family protein [Bacillus sp. SA1-12]
MNLFQLQKEIRCLQEHLYRIGKDRDSYSEGEVLKVSQQLDQKILIYQKQMRRLANK